MYGMMGPDHVARNGKDNKLAGANRGWPALARSAYDGCT